MKNTMRYGLQIISDLIPPESRVLDLGCGDGTLLVNLREIKNVKGWGVEIDYHNVVSCIQKGISVFQGDIESGLDDFHNDLYDYIIISQTLQEIRHLEKLIIESLRISDKVIVTFPNFGFFSNRFYQLFRGQSPVTNNFPYKWYLSPNVNYFTIADFRQFCKEQGIDLLFEMPYTERSLMGQFMTKLNPNLFAQHHLAVMQSKTIAHSGQSCDILPKQAKA